MFYADLHVHSKYSRATSRDCDLEHLYIWARKKGIAVVGTGDFTHPGWWNELRDKLVPAEPGLFRLRDDLERALDAQIHAAKIGPTRFLLSVEISNIYKRDDKTRKVHNLIYAPDFDSAERFRARLERIGNIRSDGRPILGLDSRDLLEITLESGPGCYLVPAHIWTPWFAVLGSKSGFDAVSACYADLAPHVFALETGLSSDPSMNWRLSQLDGYRLVSNSDAHSPQKLGREATAFECDLDYFALRRALETGTGFGGTVEFFPEEGKYHLDGHRNCGVCLTPAESLAAAGQLTCNYRSGSTIVEAACAVIAPSSLVAERRLQARDSERRRIELHEAASAEAEAEHIVRRIEQLVGGYDFHAIDSGRIESGDGHNLGFGDFAVLYRTARQLAPLEAAFLRAGIPFQRRSHARLAEDPRTAALMSAMRASERESVAERLAEAAALLAPDDAESLADWLSALRPLAVRAGTDCELFCSQVLAGAEIDTWDPRASRVALLTLHAAKGLEFDTVFIAGCEEGILPLRFGSADPAEPAEPADSDGDLESTLLDEERRLFFVGVTRARRRLILTHARERFWLGAVRPRVPSPFLADIPPALLQRTREAAPGPRARKQQLSLF